MRLFNHRNFSEINDWLSFKKTLTKSQEFWSKLPFKLVFKIVIINYERGIMRFISLFKASILSTLIRFNLSVLCCTTLTYCLIFSPPASISKTFFGILCSGALYFATLNLICERFKLPRSSFYFISLPLFAVFAYYAHFHYKSPYIWGTLLLGLIASIFVSPFWGKSSDTDDVWSYQFDILKHSIYAGVASLILLVGIYSVLFALNYLFSFTPYPDIYKDTALFILALCLPAMILSGIPMNFIDNTLHNTGVIVLKLLQYCVIPLLLIYGMILHTYALKIIIAQEFPKGLIAYLVSGFATLLIFTYMLTLRWRDDHPIIRMFTRYVGYLMIIPLCLMAVGIWKRVAPLGLTEGRYFVTLLWILFASSTLIILLCRDNPTVWILSCVSALFIISSIGPWSIQELPIRHQVHRLKAIVLNVQASPQQNASKEEQIAASTILDYLALRQRLDDTKGLFKNTIPETDELSVKRVSSEIGIPYIEYANRINTSSKSQYFNYKSSMAAIPIKSYNHIIPYIHLSKYDKLTQSVDVQGMGSLKISYSASTGMFEVILLSKNVNQIIYSANMSDIVQKLNRTKTSSKADEFIQTKDNISVQIIFKSINGFTKNPTPSPTIEIKDLSCTLLIKNTTKKITPPTFPSG